MAELHGSDILGIRFWNIPGEDSAMISCVSCMVYNTFLFCQQAGLIIRFYNQFRKTRKKSITGAFLKLDQNFFWLFLLTNRFIQSLLVSSLVLFQGRLLIFEFSYKEGSYFCLGLWKILNNMYFSPICFMAQGFNSKTVCSLINMLIWGSTSESLFPDVLFHTHISIVSRVVWKSSQRYSHLQLNTFFQSFIIWII